MYIVGECDYSVVPLNQHCYLGRGRSVRGSVTGNMFKLVTYDIDLPAGVKHLKYTKVSANISSGKLRKTILLLEEK